MGRARSSERAVSASSRCLGHPATQLPRQADGDDSVAAIGRIQRGLREPAACSPSPEASAAARRPPRRGALPAVRASTLRDMVGRWLRAGQCLEGGIELRVVVVVVHVVPDGRLGEPALPTRSIRSRNIRRASLTRHFNVPTGTPSSAAASAYDRSRVAISSEGVAVRAGQAPHERLQPRARRTIQHVVLGAGLARRQLQRAGPRRPRPIGRS